MTAHRYVILVQRDGEWEVDATFDDKTMAVVHKRWVGDDSFFVDTQEDVE